MAKIRIKIMPNVLLNYSGNVKLLVFLSLFSRSSSPGLLIPVLLFHHREECSSLMNTSAAFFWVQLSRLACSLVLFLPLGAWLT